ncbi:uncharacterized protein MONBRDRAFT_27748 [Monosiga brevicollis MX1]|uniref:CCZ1/INTU/HSP4 first Longin domain-containing protein n=1 Tax=Monosiga brevicollis TaxID=81824 RepID=A9V672_MONBE|nr:uncharacterized protein MONBRDRAFT_27748 [Monosiga brevicollis MX1]EDQ87021.1 predicted protein [Monosiga brevicollis MX1]|eukprot:XP_001748260.1 hypothetical protein [Monosiga brevicollis MX1]
MAKREGRRLQLKEFLIYNTTFGRKEDNEHEKLLYFYPSSVPFGKQMNYVGMSEALFNFTSSSYLLLLTHFPPLTHLFNSSNNSTFSSKPIEVLHTQMARRVFLNPEPNFFMSMSLYLSFTSGKKEGEEVNMYDDHSVMDAALTQLLQNAYERYRLLQGTLQTSLDRLGREPLMEHFREFFDDYLPQLDIPNLNIVDALNGIQFLPLEKNSYLRIQSFISHTETQFSDIVATVVLYKQNVIWSGIEQSDLEHLYGFLMGKLPLNAPAQDTPQFVFGPDSVSDDASPITTPRLHVDLPGVALPVPLVAYYSAGTTCCFLVNAKSAMDIGFYRRLQAQIEPRLQDLNVKFAEKQALRLSFANQMAQEYPYKYIYYNDVNKAIKSTFLPLLKGEGQASASATGSTDAVSSTAHVQLMGEIHQHFRDTVGPLSDSEISAKARSDQWVVGRRSEDREVFVHLTGRGSANLIEINDELRKLSATHFGSIFLSD